MSDPYLAADRFAILESALEKAGRRFDEARADNRHLEDKLSESEKARFEMEKVLTKLHNDHWTLLHVDGHLCRICEIGVPL